MQIYTAKKLTLQLLLEQPSPNADVESPSSLTQAFDLGYDMVAECNVESILNPSRHENRDDINFQNRIEANHHEWIRTIEILILRLIFLNYQFLPFNYLKEDFFLLLICMKKLKIVKWCNFIFAKTYTPQLQWRQCL